MIKYINFLQKKKSLQILSGILLIFCTLISLILINSNYSHYYVAFKNFNISISFFSIFLLKKSVQYWVNDGLMTIFFLLIGLEIKKEIITGKFNTFNQAILPIFVGIGGMIIPALIYIIFNYNTENIKGWAIPIATDIAFSISILSLYGKNISKNIFLMLSTIAIIDDIGSIIVITLFYKNNDHILINYIIYSFLSFFILIILNKIKIYKLSIYIFIGIFLWYFLLKSGIHSAITGILIGLTIPGSIKKQIKKARKYINPLYKLEKILRIPVYIFIVPMFAFLNASIKFSNINIYKCMINPIGLGIFFGLCLGKTLGIFISNYIGNYFKIITMPFDLKKQDFFSIGIISGIGFTISIFISELSFDNIEKLAIAKLSILFASIFASMLGYISLKFSKKSNII